MAENQDVIVMRPSQYERHKGPGRRRFLWRTLGDQFQVYGYTLDHICFCDTAEAAEMVSEALEYQADRCADCGVVIGMDNGPSDGWQLEDGRTVCQSCCVRDMRKVFDA